MAEKMLLGMNQACFAHRTFRRLLISANQAKIGRRCQEAGSFVRQTSRECGKWAFLGSLWVFFSCISPKPSSSPERSSKRVTRPLDHRLPSVSERQLTAHLRRLEPASLTDKNFHQSGPATPPTSKIEAL